METAEVAQAYALPISETLDNLRLQRVKYGFNIRRIHRTVIADILRNLIELDGRHRRSIRVKSILLRNRILS